MASKREQAVDALLAQEAREHFRFVDICKEVYLDGDDEPLICVGGKWDRVAEKYVDDAEEAAVYRAHLGQREALEDLAAWMQRHARIRALVAEGVPVREAAAEVWGAEDPVSWFWLYGGRRSAKTATAVEIASDFAVMVPGSVVVLVHNTEEDTAELKRELERLCLPPQWRRWVESAHQFELPNGSVMKLAAGQRRSQKIGRVDLVVINEAQLIKQARVNELTGGLADTSGLAILTCNPPDRAQGQWVQDAFNAWKKGERPNDRWHFHNPELNPFCDWTWLHAMRLRLSEAEYRREILGDMSTPVGDIAFPAWTDEAILTFIPTRWRDVTPKVTAQWYEREADIVVGCDFDKRAGCSWSALKFFLAEGDDIAQAHAVIVAGQDGIEGVKGPPETELVRRIIQARDAHGRPLCPTEESVVVVDASAFWQATQRDEDVPPSCHHLQSAGYTVMPPDAEQRSNPDHEARFAMGNRLIRVTHDQPRRVWFLTPGADRVIEAARKLPRKNGLVPHRDRNKHIADAWTYPCWRRWGAEPAPSAVAPTSRSYQGIARPNAAEILATMRARADFRR